MVILIYRRSMSELSSAFSRLRDLINDHPLYDKYRDKIFFYFNNNIIEVDDVIVRFHTGRKEKMTGIRPNYFNTNYHHEYIRDLARWRDGTGVELSTVNDVYLTIIKHLKEKERKLNMTNFEFYKEEIKKITSYNRQVAVVDGLPVSCMHDCKGCDKCELYKPTSGCSVVRTRWFMAEHVEKPKLSKNEAAFLKLLNLNHWIARDMDGSLYVYTHKPYKATHERWDMSPCESLREFLRIKPAFFPTITFNFIKWEDENPWKVSDLLELEVE